MTPVVAVNTLGTRQPGTGILAHATSRDAGRTGLLLVVIERDFDGGGENEHGRQQADGKPLAQRNGCLAGR